MRPGGKGKPPPTVHTFEWNAEYSPAQSGMQMASCGAGSWMRPVATGRTAVLRHYSITPTRAPADIRDSNRPAPIWRAFRRAHRSDVGSLVSQTARPPMVWPACLDRAPCAGVRGCHDPSIATGSIAGATPIAASTSPSTLLLDGSPRSERQHNEAGQIGKWPKDDLSQRDHATARRRPRNGDSLSPD
jgi:hypothetical protein